MLLKHQLAKTATAQQLFHKVFPIALQKSKADTTGVCSFTLFGEGGGAWTIDMGRKVVMLGCAPQADFHMTLAANEFEGLMSARLEIDDLDPRFFSFTGDPELLLRLSDALRINKR